MRTFYIFKIKKEFVNLYLENPNNLYKTLEHLYSLNQNDLIHGENLFSQLTDMIDKDNLDKALFIKYHQKCNYKKRGKKHIINNIYKDEVSSLIARSSYLKIDTNNQLPEFFDYLNSYHENFFVCDFKNQDYFFLNQIKTLV